MDLLLELVASVEAWALVDRIPVETASAQENADRAASTYEALCHKLYGRRSGVFRQTDHRWGSSPEGLWPFANAWAATCAFAELDPRGREDLDDRLRGLLAYHQSHQALFETSGPLSFESHVTPPLGSGGDVYYDDNEWVALALLHQHRITGDSRLITLAERVFAFVTSGWWQDRDSLIRAGSAGRSQNQRSHAIPARPRPRWRSGR